MDVMLGIICRMGTTARMQELGQRKEQLPRARQNPSMGNDTNRMTL